MLFSCPQCTRQFRWKQEIAGRKTRCKQCQTIIRIPDAPEAPKEEPVDDYGLVADENTPAGTEEDQYERIDHDGRCPQCNSEISASAVLCLNCGYDLRSGQAIQTEVQEPAAESDADANAPGRDLSTSALSSAMVGGTLDREALARDTAKQVHRREVVIPAAVAGFGLVLTLINIFLLSPIVAKSVGWDVGGKMIQTAVIAGVGFVTSIPILLIALIVVAHLFGASFGNVITALLKLAAIVLAANGIEILLDLLMDWVTGGLGGIAYMLKASVNFGVFMTLTMWLLETEAMEAFVIWLLSYALQLLIGVLLIATFF